MHCIKKNLRTICDCNDRKIKIYILLFKKNCVFVGFLLIAILSSIKYMEITWAVPSKFKRPLRTLWLQHQYQFLLFFNFTEISTSQLNILWNSLTWECVEKTKLKVNLKKKISHIVNIVTDSKRYKYLVINSMPIKDQMLDSH